MRINNNIAALNSHRNYNINAGSLGRNIERLSSGFRVNRAADDAAGLAISETMRTQIRGLRMASRNAQDGVSLVQTAEGAMDSVHQIMQRMRELTIQAASDVNQEGADNERDMIAMEINQLFEELGDIAMRTEFNGQRILDGNFDGAEGVTIAAADGRAAKIFFADMTAAQLTALKSIDVTANPTEKWVFNAVDENGISTEKVLTGAALKDVVLAARGPEAAGGTKDMTIAQQESLLNSKSGVALGTLFHADQIAKLTQAQKDTIVTVDQLRAAGINVPEPTKVLADLAVTQAQLQSLFTATLPSPDYFATTANFDTTELSPDGRTFDIQVGANSGQLINIQLVDLVGITNQLMEAVGAGTFTSTATHTQTYFEAQAANAINFNFSGTTGREWLYGTTANPITADDISGFIRHFDTAIAEVSRNRAQLGAVQNRLEFKIGNLDNTAENLQAAESRIRDTDMAAAMTEFTRNNIMFQASTAMLAQANAMPQAVLQLLG